MATGADCSSHKVHNLTTSPFLSLTQQTYAHIRKITLNPLSFFFFFFLLFTRVLLSVTVRSECVLVVELFYPGVVV